VSELRELERESLRAFVESCAGYFTGCVLDLGCGMSPYRDVVEAAGGEYVPYDRARFPGNASGGDIGHEILMTDAGMFDAVLLTQVLQYTPTPLRLLAGVHQLLHTDGVLVMTTGLTWPEVETTDLCRWTRAGLEWLLFEAMFEMERIESRALVAVGSEQLSLGYGLIARRT
jgi:SAM-dependent methyltransferase